MPITLRAAQAALIAGAVTAGAAACSSGPSDPLASQSANQIMFKALDDLKAASSVRMSGNMRESGQTITVNLTITKDGSCRGTISGGGSGPADMIVVGQTLWFQMAAQLWVSQEGVSPAEASELAGKYISMSVKGPTMSGFSRLCSTSGEATGFTGSNVLKKGTESTIDGQKVLAIKDTANGGVSYVTDAATPELVRVDSAGDLVDFSGYGDQVLITAPPSSEVIPGSRLGM